MTKTIVIGENNSNSNRIPIKFEQCLNEKYVLQKVETLPWEFKFIELICKDYANDKDLMFAYNNHNDRSDGVLYIGKWNDGVAK